MKITKLLIDNYRSIKHVEIDVKPLFGLIGANSAGKSNIIRALNFVLGERYPMPYSLTKKDFYDEDFANAIRIVVYFDTPFQSYNRDCNGIMFKTVYDPTNNVFTTEFKAIDCSTEQCQNWNIKGESREKFSAIYIPASRNFEYHLQSNADWSFLGKLIKQFNAIFPVEMIPELTEKFESVKKVLKQKNLRSLKIHSKSHFMNIFFQLKMMSR